jgi:mycothiol synthase
MTVRSWQPGDDDAIVAILQAAIDAGELPGWTLHDVESIRDRLPIDPPSRIVSLEGDAIAGIILPGFQLLAVHPDYRRRGHGGRLVQAGKDLQRERGEGHLDLAVPLGSTTAEAFARALGFSYYASLYGFSLAPDVPVPEPEFPPDVAIRPLRPGVDEEAYVDLFQRSFADHPSPIFISLESVRYVHSLPGFDPSAFLLVTPQGRDEPIAFCRISLISEGDTTIGEVEFIGVLPEWRRRGLGRELLRWSVHRLRQAGAGEVTLTVEALNERAFAMYERAGFRRVHEWPRWRAPVQ